MSLHQFTCFLIAGIYVALASTDKLEYLNLAEKGTILTYVTSIVYLNCIANPLIYACKIKKVSRVLRRAFNMKENVAFVTDFGNKRDAWSSHDKPQHESHSSQDNGVK